MKILSRILLDTAVAGMVVVGVIVCSSSIGNPIWILLLPFAVATLVLAILAIAMENGRSETKPQDPPEKPAAPPIRPAH